jgi:hypothetical protein
VSSILFLATRYLMLRSPAFSFQGNRWGANGSESQKTALKVLTSCLMPHSFIMEAKPLECGSAPEVRRAAAAFTAIANAGIRPKAAAALPHSKAPFGRSLAFDSHFRLHPNRCIDTTFAYT